MPTLQLIPNRCNVPVIRLRIQGVEYHFLIDTGATYSAFHQNLANVVRHGNYSRQTQHMTHNGSVVGQRYRCKFSLAGAFLSHIEVFDVSYLDSVLELTMSGIIGNDILRQFSTIIFDYKRQVVTFVL